MSCEGLWNASGRSGQVKVLEGHRIGPMIALHLYETFLACAIGICWRLCEDNLMVISW